MQKTTTIAAGPATSALEDDIGKNTTSPPCSEVSPKRRNRRYSAEYKLSVLSELDRCVDASERGAIMRREGVYSSIVLEWRKARDRGALGALNKARGRKKKYDARDNKLMALENEVAMMKTKLAQAEAIIDVQKKVSEIFGINLQNKPQSEGC